MKFISKKKIDFSDTQVADIFILNYMTRLEHIDIKVYLFILYLLKTELEMTDEEICKKIGITKDELSFSLDRLITEELLIKTTAGFNVINLKEKEVEKTYTPKLTPKKSKAFVKAEQLRTVAASAINESFFNGIMSISWYNDIGVLFEKYKFSEDVMIALFHHCHEKKALNSKYVYAVAEGWHKGGVKTFEELEDYLDRMSVLQLVMQKISKALRLNRMLSKYEQAYVETWVNEYKYQFDIIEEALKRTIAVTNPTFGYINGILRNWNKAGYKTLEEIKEVESNRSALKETSNVTREVKVKTVKETVKPKFKNYEQREYDNLETYYDNM